MRSFEPRPVYLDRAPSIGSDCTRRAELAGNLRHRRSSHAKQFRKRLLRQRQDVTVSPIMDLQQPTRQADFDRVQRVAGCNMLELGQQRPGEGFEPLPLKALLRPSAA